ncbi:MAG: hypothetical protein FJY37_01430 [Betaproteobacteria bacterium]|nr:hypothetical protein [Betaproteobacteria bacterium]
MQQKACTPVLAIIEALRIEFPTMNDPHADNASKKSESHFKRLFESAKRYPVAKFRTTRTAIPYIQNRRSGLWACRERDMRVAVTYPLSLTLDEGRN